VHNLKTKQLLPTYQRKMIHTTQEDSMPMSAPLLPTPTDSGRKQQLGPGAAVHRQTHIHAHTHAKQSNVKQERKSLEKNRTLELGIWCFSMITQLQLRNNKVRKKNQPHHFSKNSRHKVNKEPFGCSINQVKVASHTQLFYHFN
jgi:hypothetical protein